MNDRQRAIIIAKAAIEREPCPEDDLLILARQFLRALGELDAASPHVEHQGGRTTLSYPSSDKEAARALDDWLEKHRRDV